MAERIKELEEENERLRKENEELKKQLAESGGADEKELKSA